MTYGTICICNFDLSKLETLNDIPYSIRYLRMMKVSNILICRTI